MTPYYDDGTCVIYHGDCREVLSSLDPVEVVVTSPPYNLGTSAGGGMHTESLAASDLAEGYGAHDDAMPQDEYDEWQTETVHDLWRITTGAIFYNHKPRIQNGEALLPTRYGAAVNRSHRFAGALPLRQVIVWDRGTGLNFSESFFLPKCEWILIWARPTWRLASRKACEVGDVWHFPPEQDGSHPAAFPLGLPARIIESCAPRSVLDPYMGSGTTLRAAKDRGVHAVGIEIEERYCEIAARRLAQEALSV